MSTTQRRLVRVLLKIRKGHCYLMFLSWVNMFELGKITSTIYTIYTMYKGANQLEGVTTLDGYNIFCVKFKNSVSLI